MNKETIAKENAFNVLIGIFGVLCLIYIAQGGYQVGQFLQQVLR